ncbi:MAG: hypothetical protein IKP62_10830 [Salinivirgaceae bacterium]|nr:hypothetical protein [Salinivirgaceae bacterium]
MKNWFINHIWKLLGINRLLYYQTEQQKKLDEIVRTNKEILKASIFNDSIKDCEWLKYKSFSAGQWAVDYGCLYTLFRVLNDTHPKSILEFGLGQSSKLIHQYADYYTDATAITYEHDENWIKFFNKGKSGDYNLNVYKTELEELEYNGIKTLSYKNNCDELKGNKYDFIMIDAPFGSEHYSRSQILNLIPTCLADSFCIIMDDYNRKGEQETTEEMENILLSNGIPFLSSVYSASKKHYLVCSKDLRFLCSL